MFAALIVAPIVAYVRLGGGEGVSAALANVGDSFHIFPQTISGSVNAAVLVSAIAWGLGYFGQPHILPRFMAIRSDKEIRPARIIAMAWVLISLAAAVVVGAMGALLFPNLADPEQVFIQMTISLFPPIITGILLTAILAAIMSTADSQLLVTSSAVANDIYKGVMKKDASEKQVLWFSRIAVIVISILAALLVSVPDPAEGTLMYLINQSVFKLVAFAWAGFGSAFGPIILFSLFWKRTTKQAALCGILTGGIVSCLWWVMQGGIWDLYEIIPGFLLSSLVIVVVSLVTKVPKEVAEDFDKVRNVSI